MCGGGEPPQRLALRGPLLSAGWVKPIQTESWCQKQLADQKLHQLLEKVDADLAAQAHVGGCRFCGGKLHRANYDRKPRGGPGWKYRYSFCCAREGCRRRRTPESVRFLGRRVYAGLVVVLVSALVQGLKPQRVTYLRQALEIDRRTLARWRQWWQVTFVESSFWKAARARFLPPLSPRTLPGSLCESFAVQRGDRLVELLRFLAPLTLPSAWPEQVM